MDLQLVNKGLDLCKRKKKWVVLLALFGVSSYGAYRVYHLPSVTRKRRRLLRLLTAFFSVVALVSDTADTVGVVSTDLKEFLKSDSDEIPNSLKQIAKIVRSDGFSDSLSAMSEALTVGILRGSRAETSNEGGPGGNASFADKMMDKMLSSSGTGFVSAVAGSFARNLVMGFYANGGSVGSSGADVASVREWVSVVCDDKCKDLMANCIQVFVSTAVAVYLDKTMNINTYDELFAGLTNPNHESKMREVLVSVCNGAVETLVKTSHQVLTSKNTNSDPHSSSSLDHGENSKSTMCEFGNGENVGIHLTETGEKVQGRGWGNMVFSTLSVPSNRRFVLDVTGRVTSETVRSVAEFLHWKLSDGFRRRSDAVHDHVRDKGLQVVRYFGLKSYVAMAICLALLLHIICGSKALLPA